MKTIVIVEDDLNLQEAYKLKLANTYNVKFATSQAESLNYFVGNPPDLVILDVMLTGGKNGFDFLQSLKQDPRTKQAPVIILTNLGEELRQTALDCGAAGYYTKTAIGPGQILRIVESHI